MKNHYLNIVLILLLTSCAGDVMDKQYSYETFEEDIIEIRKQITNEQADLLERAIRLAYKEKLNITDGTNSEMMTYRSLLHLLEKSQKEYLLKQEEERRFEEMKRLSMLSSLHIMMLSLQVRKSNLSSSDFRDYFEFSGYISNTSQYDVKAVNGTLHITDLFDNVLKSIDLSFTLDIPAKTSAGALFTKADFEWEYNRFNDVDVRLARTPLSDLEAHLEIKELILSDGTRVKR